MSDEKVREPRVLIIGAGVSGLATAQALQEAGYRDWEILEKGSDVGGVWHWNRYPGLTCDVPSQLYQFSFAPKPDWKRIFASGAEIQQYHRDVADRLGLTAHIRFNTEVTSADYDAGRWRVVTADGTRRDCDFLICATGVLHNPAYPDIPGLADFAGTVVHTARWPDDLDLTGRDVAVVGTGSTGVQVVSALARQAATVRHFVRTPQWVMWAPMNLPQPRLVSRALRAWPGAHRRLYAGLLWGSGILADITSRPSWRRSAVQRYARLSLRAQVPARRRAGLTPDYQPLCKRQVVSGSYYRTLARPNTELVTSDIAAVTPTGIRTVDGATHPVDTIVLATGFRAHDYMRPIRITGRDGLTLDEAWRDGPRAYRLTAIPGFPNLFTVLGPNSPTGSISLQYTAELTGRYITAWLDQFRRGDLDTVEVTAAATAAFNAEVAAGLGPTVWNTGCNSWYFAPDGTIDLFPFTRAALTRYLSAPVPDHFIVGRA